MSVALYDAHCHWQDERLSPHAHAIAAGLAEVGLARAVVNGSKPEDWPQVAALAAADPRVLPAFGLHPWCVNATCGKGSAHADNWLEQLRQHLRQHPQAAVGEVGLDNWLPDADKTLQREAFLAQAALAAAGNRPLSIHCLRAEGDLLAALKTAPALPARGIHLHGFSGSLQGAFRLLDIGAHFSFSEYIAEPRRAKARTIAEKIPLERLLAETDAPDMLGPPQWQHYRLEGNALFAHAPEGLPPKHPANICAAYACLAALRQLPAEALARQIEANFQRYFMQWD